MENQRECGVLLPISSLPSKYGILQSQDFWKYRFSHRLYEEVCNVLCKFSHNPHHLPLGPTSYGDSPYQSFSTFAGNPYFISLEDLIEEGVLTEKECDAGILQSKDFWKYRFSHRLYEEVCIVLCRPVI